ncbi:uncharacterized protein TNCV_5001161 [Trichonephila clavipes]|nr:uncharacterized protein TNCV_5001161 [Trichonephila clavipes]
MSHANFKTDDGKINDARKVPNSKKFLPLNNGTDNTSLAEVALRQFGYTRAFGDGPRNFEPWSSDADDTELAPPLLTTTPHHREDVSALDRFNVHRCPIRRVFSGTGLELVTRQATIRYLYHSATAATGPPRNAGVHATPLMKRFVEWDQNEIAVVPDFHKRILFSDEAHFWLNGYVNKQNCFIWSEANPQVYVETPLHPEKLTVWCALWAGGIILQKR